VPFFGITTRFTNKVRPARTPPLCFTCLAHARLAASALRKEAICTRYPLPGAGLAAGAAFFAVTGAGFGRSAATFGLAAGFAAGFGAGFAAGFETGLETDLGGGGTFAGAVIAGVCGLQGRDDVEVLIKQLGVTTRAVLEEAADRGVPTTTVARQHAEARLPGQSARTLWV